MLFDFLCEKVANLVVRHQVSDKKVQLTDEQIDAIARQKLYGRMLKREKVVYNIKETGKPLYGIELNVSLPKGKKAAIASKIQQAIDPLCQVFYWTEDGCADEILFHPCDLDEWERRKPLLQKFADMVEAEGGDFVQAMHIRCSEHYFSRRVWGRVFLFFAKEMANINHLARRKSDGWWNKCHRYWGADIPSLQYWSYLFLTKETEEKLLKGQCGFVTRRVQDACAFSGETPKGMLTHVSIWKSSPKPKEIVNRIAWYDSVIRFADTCERDLAWKLQWEDFAHYLKQVNKNLYKWMKRRMEKE